MEKEKIEQTFEKGFNRSSKIMEHIIGIDEARLLNTLIYKHNYWVDEDRMVKLKEGDAFWITIPNLQGETNLKPFTIKKAIKELEKLNLIEVYKRGIPSKNHYILNKKAILEFDDKHIAKYESWLDELYIKASEDRSRFTAQENNISDDDINLFDKIDSAALIIPQLAEKSPTGELVFSPLVSEYSTVTNNKNTNNKITNNFTNRINAVVSVSNIYDYNNELTNVIEDLLDENSDYSDSHSRLFDFLIKLVPEFEYFSESTEDSSLIERIRSYSIEPDDISFKILSNAKAILDGNKPVRFGNLFVGLEEMSTNYYEKVLA